MNLLISLLLAGLALLSVNLLKQYGSMSVRQLARRARSGDEAAKWLHRVAAYGVSLRLLTWLLIGLSFSLFFDYTARHFPFWLVLISGSVLVTFSFSWLHNKSSNRFGEWLATQLARPLAWLLQYIHSPLNWLVRQVRRIHPINVHTGLYDKDDLLDLLEQQQKQADNRVADHELELAWNALTFDDKLVRDCMTPKRKVKLVNAEDTIGPLLMDELHNSGFGLFPVYREKDDNIVGTLFLKDTVNVKSTAKVANVMRHEFSYLHEDQSLYEALRAILKTRHHLLVVISGLEEVVGVLTIEDALEQIIGKVDQDDFDDYDNKQLVAQRIKDEDPEQLTEPEPEADPEVSSENDKAEV